VLKRGARLIENIGPFYIATVAIPKFCEPHL
jgi:hypothetical protein